MADVKICKNDIAAVFKRLRSIPSNKVCFDCGAKNPTWASVTYGVLICIDCSAVHRSLGVHLSFVRSTQLDTNWTWLQLRAMQVGGNANALSFFQQHGCSSKDAQQKYNSRAAQLYREKLHQQASAAMRLHGNKLHIEVSHSESAHSPEHKEVDFFKEIADSSIEKDESATNDLQNGSIQVANLSFYQNNNNKNENELGSQLEATLSISTADSSKVDQRKSSITGRKIGAAKKSMGTKKGLGAQKVQANFSDIEKEARRADELRQQMNSAEVSTSAPLSAAEEEKQKASVRLAYKDISIRQKETEEKLRQSDPRKAEQLERLGMGFGAKVAPGNTGVSHSAASEMKLITQESSAPQKNQDLELEDDFEFFSFTSGPPKYGDSPFMTRSSSDRLGDICGKGPWTQERGAERKTESSSYREPSSRKPVVSTPVSSVEAQRKFGNAKAISSQQYFGPSHDAEFERRANLTRFEGANSISSEDYFGGDGPTPRSTSVPAFNSPNLYDIKEGVRDGVTKVAGRISSIANGVMSSLQKMRK